MLWNLLVFALIGLVTGAAARMLYQGRQPAQMLRTGLLGAAGAVAGGALSWAIWPSEEGLFHSGNLLMAFLGAVAVILVSAFVALARRRSGQVAGFR
jgi:uncharacterized membrane protein YeaQ/YmgE (transglycosylase-associated protein family)